MKRIGWSILVVMVFWIMPTMTILAGNQYRYSEDGNWIYEGGLNSYKGEVAESRLDTEIMELELLEDNYIQVAGVNRTISDEEYELLMEQNRLWYISYTKENDFNITFRKTYMYKPTYDDFMECLKNNSAIPESTTFELMTSTVVIDYAHWYYDEVAGTFDSEINDKIPSYCNTGYLEIISPVNCSIVLWNDELNRYYRLYIMKNIPFLVKLKCGSYHLTEMNGMVVNDRVTNSGEDTLPYNNRLQVREDNTIDNPYLLDFTEIVIKYDMKDADISGQPDYSINQNQNIPTEKTQVEHNNILEEEENENVDSIDIVVVVLLSCIVVLLLLYAGIQYSKNKKREEEQWN